MSEQKISTKRNAFSMKPLLLIASVIVMALIGLSRLSTGQTPETVSGLKDFTKSLPLIGSPTPTPFQFQELTIPYLQNRGYESVLGPRTKVTETSNYTGYLTSFTSDGLKINALLTVPKGETPITGFPAVVFVHGYIPPTLYKTEENYKSYVDSLASKGLVVLKIDLRGHGKSEGDAGGAYYSSDYVIDTLNAYSALEKLEGVDTQNISLFGHSMAGNVVLRALAVHPKIPKAVIWAGAGYTYTDLSQFRINDNSYRPPAQDSERRRKRDELFAAYGQFDPASWFWQQVPATNYLDGVNGSIQVHHAVNDDVVNIGYSRNLMQVLDQTAIPHQLYEYSSGGHNMTGTTFTQAMNRTAEFFRQ